MIWFYRRQTDDYWEVFCCNTKKDPPEVVRVQCGGTTGTSCCEACDDYAVEGDQHTCLAVIFDNSYNSALDICRDNLGQMGGNPNFCRDIPAGGLMGVQDF